MKHYISAMKGFSLLELSIVLVIVAILSSGMIFSLGAQRDLAAYQDTQRQLDLVKEALLGFAISNGRLPCPAKATLANSDANAGREDCTLSAGHGVLPWATLGLAELDAWGQRLTYYAHSKFTGSVPNGALASFALDTLGNANVKDSSSAGYNNASELPAVIVSHGRRGFGAYQSTGIKLAGASGEEAENADANLTFIAHTPNETFDDLVAWIIPSILKARLVAVGKLP